MNREVEVYADLNGTPFLVGRLWSRFNKGRESASFRYDEHWLKSKFRFPLEPLLSIDAATHHTQPGKALFGAIGDSAPDRWGRSLMRRAERRAAERDGRVPRTLMEIDYLLMVDDRVREGALRFREVNSEVFLAHGAPAIPPVVELPRLLAASQHVLADADSDEDLRLLLAPGSSLGGARPKAAVVEKDGSLAIAKFPHTGDEYNIELWSYLAFDLASRAGLRAPAYKIIEVNEQPVLVTKRFDRQDDKRIPFLSALSMISGSDNETHSYLELVDAIRRYGAEVDRDLAELWRRVVFNVLVSNTDDHLRNHGFLYDLERAGWRLSPIYDLNPMPIDIKPRILCLNIDDQDNTASFELALEVGEYFGLEQNEMRVITSEVVAALALWREAAAARISKHEIDRMSSAFEHDDWKKALEFVGVTVG